MKVAIESRNGFNNGVAYLKAFGIILMVIGHSGCSVPFFVQFVDMFHMPFFFFASGFCFKESYIYQPIRYVWRRIIGVYFPYVKWSLLFLLLHNSFFTLNIYNSQYGWGTGLYEYSSSLMLTFAKQIVLKMQCHDLLLGGYWFLKTLFFSSLLLWIIIKVFRKWTLVGVMLSLMSVLITNSMGIFFSYFEFGAQVFLATTIMLVGYCFAKYKINHISVRYSSICLMITFIGSFFFSMMFGEAFYDGIKLLPYFCLSIIATWSWYSLFVQCKFPNIIHSLLSFLGKNTLTVLTWHIISFKLVSLLIIYLYALPIERLAEFPVIAEYANAGWWIAYSFVSILVASGMAYLNRWINIQYLKL